MNMKIIYEDDTDIAEYEAFSKGYRNDIVVVVDGNKYKVNVISMIRLQQDFETEQKDSGYYMVEPNLLIVREVTKNEIEYIVRQMYKLNYFERINNRGF